MRRVSIFGVTGSVGCNTVDLLTRQGGAEAYRVVALTGGQNIARLAEQARTLRAEIAVTADPALLGSLRAALAGSGVEAAAGPAALLEAAARPADWTMSAIVGAAGLAPGLVSAKNGGTLALANKESLVCAGKLLRQTCATHQTTLLPVDSELSAIFQALKGEGREAVERVILTASGGPFRDWTLAEMAKATPAQARAHPMWDMGERISIDSASMFNKALELIETQMFFDFPAEMIEVLMHRQSVVHSLVGFRDGSLIAQLGPSDMRGAIGFALNWPERRALPVEKLDLISLARLDFEPLDVARFPALQLARRVMAAPGLLGAAFNAAKEAALDGFIGGRISFLDMAKLVEDVLDALQADCSAPADSMSLDAVLDIDGRARQMGRDWSA